MMQEKNAESLFLVATGYWKASRHLTKYMGQFHDFDVISPILVNIAFACELYLKCLLCLRTSKSTKGHNLHKLFMQLSQNDRERIEVIFNERVRCSAIATRVRHEFPSLDFRLNSILREAADTFVNWRYPHETTPNTASAIGELADALQATVIEVKPDIIRVLHAPLSM
jgi:hypothetical protein